LEFVNLVNGINRSSDPLSYMVKLRESDISIKKPSTEKLKYYIEILFNHLTKDDSKSALIIIQSFLFWNNNKAIAMMKRKGIFRSSKCKFKSKSLLEVVTHCLNNRTFYKIDENNTIYLTSILSLISITEEIENYRGDILDLLKKNSKFAPKTLLAIIESQFGYGSKLDGNESMSSETRSHYSNEDFTESVSYLLSLFDKEIGLTVDHLYFIEPCISSHDVYFQMIVSGCKIQQYIKAEILVNSFGYMAEIVDEFKVVIKSNDPYLEKSIRLGYIQTELQMCIREFHTKEFKNTKFGSLEEITKELFNNHSELFIQLRTDPIARYTLQFPSIPRFLDIFSSEHFFIEEIHSIMLLEMDSYGEKSLDTELIFNNITVFDILKVQRFFRFINYMFALALDSTSEIDDREMLRLNTILPIMDHNALKAMFSLILPKEKIDDCLNLICTNINLSDPFDVQYTPIISIGKGNIIAPAILSGSNLVRNILCNFSLRPSLKDGEDPMQKDLAIELEKKGFEVELECYLYGNSLETDILASKDGYIFIIECKNSYHPCNVHEMRTSFEHIKKGVVQLEKRKEWLIKKDNQKALFNRLEWRYKDSKVVTCLATANRVFNGYKSNDTHVRQSHELLNVIRTGIININNTKYQTWEEDEFNTFDLVKYIQGSTTISDCFGSLIDVERAYSFTDKSLAFCTYELDLNKLREVTESRYRKAPINIT